MVVDRRRKIACLIFTLYVCLGIPLMGLATVEFFKRTKLTFEPPPSSLVRETDTFVSDHFPKLVPAPIFILISTKNNEPVIPNYNTSIEAFSKGVKQLTLANPQYAPHVFGIDGYYFSDASVRPMMLSNDKTATMININYRNNDDIIGEDFAMWLQEQLDDEAQARYQINNTNLEVKTGGLGLIVNDITTGAASDFIRIDMISLPLAFAVLAYCLKSVRMLLIPAVCFLLSLCMSFTLMLPFTYFLDVSAFAPDMMGSMASALNIDYALFLLSRFNEQFEAFQMYDMTSVDVQYTIVRRTTELAAHNILVSGLTIAIANAGVAVFPMDMLRTVGIGSSIAVLCTIFVSMTITPLMLFIFFDFFSTRTGCNPCPASQSPPPNTQVYVSVPHAHASSLSERTPMISGGGGINDDSAATFRMPSQLSKMESESALMTRDDAQAEAYKRQLRSPWFRMALWTTKHPWIVFFSVILLGVPFIAFVPQMKVTFDLFIQIPRNAPHLDSFKSVMHDYGPDRSSPFSIVLDSGKTDGIRSDEYFEAVKNFTIAMAAKSNQPVTNFMSVTGAAINGTQNFFTFSEAEFMYVLSPGFQRLWNMTVSPDSRALIVQMSTNFPPLGTQAKPFLDDLMPWIEDYKDPHFAFVGFSGGGANSWAVMAWVMEYFPYQIMITFIVIFVFIGIAFKSIAVPIRMLLTVCHTVGVTYGVAVVVFQYDWLHGAWTALEGVDAIFWIIPVQCFTVICGLALDYDVFLLSRVVEYRRKGFTDSAALCKAVWKTGRIISFAGLIMAIAFSSLIFSQTMMMSQAGLLLASAVMLDTFIVRTLFMPAIMSLAPKYAFWPNMMPDSTRGVEDMGEDDPDDEDDDTV
eukprot:PhM_4_TR10582/c1_g1_i2/m.13285/K06994/K06994; putative drug exporter of the RND superfamily